ncbi:MAG: tRNA (N6-threonylcarbamoyladenosine(37)-N6)-methyltransferase TrmO [Oscillospiraceae bacterium]
MTETTESHSLQVIARIRSDFAGKFGIPRQSGVVEELTAYVVFEPQFRVAEALRGIEDFSHLWLIWQFSETKREQWSPTVRPPRLGGNVRMGVFATRSPFRPNALGLSCVRLLRVEHTAAEGDVLVVAGADLMDGTPIYDIKPYIPYADARPDASAGFTAAPWKARLAVDCEERLLCRLPEEKRQALLAVLAEDPRPSYQEDPERVYGFTFAGHEVRFSVAEGKLTVREISE